MQSLHKLQCKNFLNNLYHGPIWKKCFNFHDFDESHDVILMGLCNHELDLDAVT